MEEIDEDHPAVQEIKQVVLNHGWIIDDAGAIDLVTETKKPWLPITRPLPICHRLSANTRSGRPSVWCAS